MTPQQQNRFVVLLNQLEKFTNADPATIERVQNMEDNPSRDTADPVIRQEDQDINSLVSMGLISNPIVAPLYQLGIFAYELTSDGRDYLVTKGPIPTAFIIHGSDKDGNIPDIVREVDQVCRQNAVNPERAQNQTNLGLTLNRKVKNGIDQSDMVIAILTPDLETVEGSYLPKPNAYGEALAAAMYHPNKLIVLVDDQVTPIVVPTDIREFPWTTTKTPHGTEPPWQVLLQRELLKATQAIQ